MPSLDLADVEVDSAVMGAGLDTVGAPGEQAAKVANARVTHPNRNRQESFMSATLRSRHQAGCGSRSSVW